MRLCPSAWFGSLQRKGTDVGMARTRGGEVGVGSGGGDWAGSHHDAFGIVPWACWSERWALGARITLPPVLAAATSYLFAVCREAGDRRRWVCPPFEAVRLAAFCSPRPLGAATDSPGRGSIATEASEGESASLLLRDRLESSEWGTVLSVFVLGSSVSGSRLR